MVALLALATGLLMPFTSRVTLTFMLHGNFIEFVVSLSWLLIAL